MEATQQPICQPLGVFPLPAGFLLVAGDDATVAATCEQLVTGRVPDEWPPAMRGHELVHLGRLAEAVDWFGSRSDPVDRFNHYLLAPDEVDPEAVREALPRHLASLVDVVDCHLDRADSVLGSSNDAPEVAAVVTSVRAADLLSEGEHEKAALLLREASEQVSDLEPALSCVLLGNAGSIHYEHQLDPQQGIEDLATACAGLAGTDLPELRAELHLHRGLLIHALSASGKRPVTDAVAEYYAALRLVDQESAPYVWAAANMNLGAAHLTMPMTEASDHLRAGIAMQALRASLDVFTKEEHPAEWASTQVNLANALVYTPSTHQGDNIVEAVERYEEVLETRDREDDPIGRARILANLGNALAHLGIFDHAKARLFEARSLFEEQLDSDSAMMVRGVLDEISRMTVPDSGKDGRALPVRPTAREEVGS